MVLKNYKYGKKQNETDQVVVHVLCTRKHVNARRREKHEKLLSDHLVTTAVDKWRAQLSTILDDPLHAQK
jgi:hypothetical protein